MKRIVQEEVERVTVKYRRYYSGANRSQSGRELEWTRSSGEWSGSRVTAQMTKSTCASLSGSAMLTPRVPRFGNPCTTAPLIVRYSDVHGILGEAAICWFLLHCCMAEKCLHIGVYARRAEKAEEANS
jgi:hypothetical protein